MMATTLDSFDASPIDAFVESPLGARNRVPPSREPGDFIVIAFTDNANLYHPLPWARQQTEHNVDARRNLDLGIELATDQWRADRERFRAARDNLETLGTVSALVIYTASRYVVTGQIWVPSVPDPSVGDWVWPDPRFITWEEQHRRSDFARTRLTPPSVAFPNEVMLAHHDDVEGWTKGTFGNIVSTALGFPNYLDVRGLRLAASGRLYAPIRMGHIDAHVQDVAGGGWLSVFFETRTDPDLPPSELFHRPLEIGFDEGAFGWLRDLGERGIPGQFEPDGGNNNWHRDLIVMMEHLFTAFSP